MDNDSNDLTISTRFIAQLHHAGKRAPRYGFDVIGRLGDDKPFDQLKATAVKKTKTCALKDEITKLRSRILPDIIA